MLLRLYEFAVSLQKYFPEPVLYLTATAVQVLPVAIFNLPGGSWHSAS